MKSWIFLFLIGVLAGMVSASITHLIPTLATQSEYIGKRVSTEEGPGLVVGYMTDIYGNSKIRVMLENDLANPEREYTGDKVTLINGEKK